MDKCMMFYHSVNDDVFLTSVNTFRNVSNASLIVYTDNVPIGLQVQWADEYNIEWHCLKPEDVKDQRCYRKMKCVNDCISEMEDGDRLLVSDADVYFLEDPFSAFDKCEFDIGLTRRLHSYKFPINSGLFFVNVNPRTRKVFKDSFEIYAEKNPEIKDWFVDQSFLCQLYRKDGLAKIADVGWEYNFCPNTDVFGVKLAADMIKRAYESRSVKVLHLKSELKMCIYDGFLKDAVTKYANGGWNWMKEGK